AYSRAIERKIGIWLRQLATNTNVELVAPTSVVYTIAFANNGQYLYFSKSEEPTAGPFDDLRAIYRVPLSGGLPTRIVQRIGGNLAVSNDDSQIAFIRQAVDQDGQRQFSLVVVNADGTGEHTVAVATHPNELHGPLWSLDGHSIICVSGNSDGGGQK